MKTYLGSHGLHNADNLDTILEVLGYATDEYTSVTAVRVDTHYPPELEDTVACFINREPGAISRFIDSLKEILKNSERRRRRNGKCICTIVEILDDMAILIKLHNSRPINSYIETIFSACNADTITLF